MNTWRLMMTLVAGGALIAACSVESKKSDDDDGSGGNGSGGSGMGATGPTTTGGQMTTTATTNAASTGAMGDMGICDTGFSTSDDVVDACLTASCCSTFVPCTEDMNCSACLTGMGGVDCETDPLLTAYDACEDMNCRQNVCDTTISFGSNFACNSCTSDPGNGCCASMLQCLGDESQGAINSCLDCLNGCVGVDDPVMGCLALCEVGTDFETGADLFNTCTSDNCSTECGG